MQIFTNKFLKYYLFFIFITSSYFLYNKFLYPTDWTTSEWLINYQGGFVRRGLTGEFFFQINKFLDLNLRYIVFYFNILILGSFYLVFYNFVKSIKLNELLIFLIYSPFFLLYPSAETEVIARKEFLLFFLFIFYINLLVRNSSKIYIFLAISLPIMNLIWDGVLFYIFFFFIAFIVKKNLTKKDFFYFVVSLIPYFISLIFVILSSSNPEGYELICKSIEENCWGALNVINIDMPLEFILNYVYDNVKIDYIIRYSFLFCLAFFPFLIIFYFESKRLKYLLYKKSLFLLNILALIPILVFHIIANDWGRWINIGYFFFFILLIYFIKIRLIDLNENIVALKFKYFARVNPKIFYFFFFIYTFSWNMKATMADDIGSFPYYRITVKFVEYLIPLN